MTDGLPGPRLLWQLRRRLLGVGEGRVQFECRRCGRTIAQPTRTCPDCGASDVARYEI